jgi:hypothetical protein
MEYCNVNVSVMNDEHQRPPRRTLRSDFLLGGARFLSLLAAGRAWRDSRFR